jgi:hypothetical protein
MTFEKKCTRCNKTLEMIMFIVLTPGLKKERERSKDENKFSQN